MPRVETAKVNPVDAAQDRMEQEAFLKLLFLHYFSAILSLFLFFPFALAGFLSIHFPVIAQTGVPLSSENGFR
jgi:hypothetical protein